MNAFFANGWHYIVGLAVIGSMSGLAASGAISGSQALYVIDAVGSALIGGGLALAVAPSTPVPTPPVVKPPA